MCHIPNDRAIINTFFVWFMIGYSKSEKNSFTANIGSLKGKAKGKQKHNF